MPYPDAGAPPLRPGAERIPAAQAPRYLPHLPLAELFEDFLAASASLINAVTEDGYRLSWAMFLAWLGLDARPASADASADGVAARVLRTFVRWLAAEGYYPGDPFAGGGRGIMPRMGPRLLRTAREREIELPLAGTNRGSGRPDATELPAGAAGKSTDAACGPSGLRRA